ncbi:F-box domain [Arabidopsis thaliana x Arabidopsis arenosa]|uniref:F-box domain n=1 Tax=Arabidopsis thaliana x Arabidopsis arenosa TaxID=1240361 RepID=A0A8T2GQ13_9BRAS|nr:F-box domain [Arabidopsis thaliana x Arabidopsis arenosa]
MDHVSNLPEGVLCHILSFLTTKEAALTSILCKRWRNLLAFVPNLVIDDSVFLHPEEGKEERYEIQQSFMEFVDRVLALQGNSPIKKFSLKFRTDFASHRVDAWISNVLARGVSELDVLVILYGAEFLPLSPKCFKSRNLVTLKINSLGTLSLDTPSLVYFCFSDHVAKDYPLAKMEKLSEARISLLVTEDQIERARAPNIYWVEDDVVLRLVNVGKLMKGIRNVQYLNLSPNTLEVLLKCCESMPLFNNLKSLTIESNERRGWQAMPVLLRNCPHLETLVLEGLLHHVTDKCGNACDCVSREVKGRSLTTCPIKLLEIKGFQGTTKEMHVIKHFLEYFPCLREIKIHMEENGPTQLRVPEVSQFIAEMMEHYAKSSSCNVELLVGGYLYKKWTAQ